MLLRLDLRVELSLFKTVAVCAARWNAFHRFYSALFSFISIEMIIVVRRICELNSDFVQFVKHLYSCACSCVCVCACLHLECVSVCVCVWGKCFKPSLRKLCLFELFLSADLLLSLSLFRRIKLSKIILKRQ